MFFVLEFITTLQPQIAERAKWTERLGWLVKFNSQESCVLNHDPYTSVRPFFVKYFAK